MIKEGIVVGLIAAACVLIGMSTASAASRGQYCEVTSYSAADITNAVRSSPLRDDLKATSCSLGGLGRFESGGNKGVYNGSCCTGIFQLNNANVQKYANTDRSGYGCMSLQDQVDAWARLTNDGYSSPSVRRLASMSTFDGQKVDASLIASCIQLGTGNCQKMLDAGKCSGFSDINGTTICDMANNARGLADKSCKEGDGACVPNTDTPFSADIAESPPTAAMASIVVSPTDV